MIEVRGRRNRFDDGMDWDVTIDGTMYTIIKDPTRTRWWYLEGSDPDSGYLGETKKQAIDTLMRIHVSRG